MQDEFAPPVNHLPVPITVKAGRLTLQQQVKEAALDEWSSWPIQTREDSLAVYNARNSDCAKLADSLGKELAVKGVFAHVVNLPDDETGEFKECVRCVLFTFDGARLDCVSEGIWQSVRDLVARFGEGPWLTPAIVKPVRLPTSDPKRHVHKLELVQAPSQQGPDTIKHHERTGKKKA
jgi:hypothetical protein